MTNEEIVRRLEVLIERLGWAKIEIESHRADLLDTGLIEFELSSMFDQMDILAEEVELAIEGDGIASLSGVEGLGDVG